MIIEDEQIFVIFTFNITIPVIMIIQACEVAAAFKPFSFVWQQIFCIYASFNEILLQENEVISIF
jgi:hypothetical protein